MEEKDKQATPGRSNLGKNAGRLLLIVMALFAVLHVLVMTGVFPTGIVWGGLTADGQFIVLELVSLFFTLVFILIVGIRIGFFLRKWQSTRLVMIGIWIIFGYFILNSIGNFLAATDVEKFVFGPLTVFMAVLALLIARKK